MLLALTLGINAASVTVGYCYNQGDCTGPNTTISYDTSKSGQTVTNRSIAG